MNNYHGGSYNKIDKMYNKLTYFDKYGGSLILFFILTIILGLVISYSYIWINVQSIKENWIKERCKPYIIPFAGIINKPKDISIIDYTNQNFQYCMQNVIKGVTGNAVQPLTFVIQTLNFLANLIKESLNAVRNMFNKVRTQLQSITEEIMGRLGNIMVPLQQIIIAMGDMMSKIQGVMTSALFTLLGGYYALQSLMGAIAQFIIIILISIAAMILIFWLIPFTWGIAASTTAIFLSIAIPLTIVLVFMLKYLHIKPSMRIPTIQCFDENTKIKLKNGICKEIKDIEIGDVLWYSGEKDSIDNNLVTGIFKVNAISSQMYNLNNIIVSESHLVWYNNEWIRVQQHPDAIKINHYEKSLLYCLNTTNGKIIIQDTLFSDWDEEIIKDNISTIQVKKNILVGGFYPNTVLLLENGSNKTIQDIKVGEVLEGGIIVTGVIELDGTILDTHYFIHLGRNEKIEGGGFLGKKIDKSVKKEIISKSNQEKKVFHLLTDKKIFQIKKIIFNDYNSCLDSII